MWETLWGPNPSFSSCSTGAPRAGPTWAGWPDGIHGIHGIPEHKEPAVSAAGAGHTSV